MAHLSMASSYSCAAWQVLQTNMRSRAADALRDVAAISTPGAVGLGRDSFHDGLHQYLFIMMISLQC
jgi:hypothetical protein